MSHNYGAHSLPPTQLYGWASIRTSACPQCLRVILLTNSVLQEIERVGETVEMGHFPVICVHSIEIFTGNSISGCG